MTGCMSLYIHHVIPPKVRSGGHPSLTPREKLPSHNVPVTHRSLELSYCYADARQPAVASRCPEMAVAHPLFRILEAIAVHGSITHAAQALQLSYRHVWGVLKDWEQRWDGTLVDWHQGRRAQLSAWGLELLWEERLARARLRPQWMAQRRSLAEVPRRAQQAHHAAAASDVASPRTIPGDLVRLACDDAPPWWLLQDQAVLEPDDRCIAWQPMPLGDWTADLRRAATDPRCVVAWSLPLERDAAMRCHAQAGSPPVDAALRTLSSHRYAVGWMGHAPLDAPAGPGELCAGALALAGWDCAEGLWLRSHGWLTEDARTQLWEEPTQDAAAVQVACGRARWAFGRADVAARWGLAFQPCVTFRGLLLWHPLASESEAAAAVSACLIHPDWTTAVAALPGHSAPDAGQWRSAGWALR